MRERKYIKLRVDMFEDTKFKIIDLKPERDLIHYIWIRLVALAGKVNLAGDLYMSKTIPYTIETLAVEFNRSIEQVKLAMDVFRELEMVEVDKSNVYRVKNFAKHQNIKVKENSKSGEKDSDIKNEEVNAAAEVKNEIDIESNEKCAIETDNVKSNTSDSLDIQNKDVIKIDKSISDNKPNINLRDNVPAPIPLEKKKNKKVTPNKKKGIHIKVTDEEPEDNSLIHFYDSEEGKPLEEGESVVSEWAF